MPCGCGAVADVFLVEAEDGRKKVRLRCNNCNIDRVFPDMTAANRVMEMARTDLVMRHKAKDAIIAMSNEEYAALVADSTLTALPIKGLKQIPCEVGGEGPKRKAPPPRAK
jgi:hypothetical protein